MSSYEKTTHNTAWETYSTEEHTVETTRYNSTRTDWALVKLKPRPPTKTWNYTLHRYVCCLPLCCHAIEWHTHNVWYLLDPLEPSNHMLELQPSQNLEDLQESLDCWLAIPGVLQLRAVGLLLQCANTQPSLKHHMQMVQDQRLLQTLLQLVNPLCLSNMLLYAMRIICRIIPRWHWLQPHSQTVDVGEHHHRQSPVA